MWFIVTLLPALFLPGTGYFAAERYLYIPSVGFVLIAAVGIERVLRHRHIAAYFIIVAITVLYSVNTFNRNAIWRNEKTLWLDTLRKDPMSVKAPLNLALLYDNSREPEKAIQFYLKALELLPGHPVIINSLGSSYEQMGRYDDAIILYKKALMLNPDLNPNTLNMFNMRLRKTLCEDFLKDYQARLKGNPNDVMVYFNIGILYEKMGKKDEAVKAFEEFVRKWKKDRRYIEIALNEIKKLNIRL